MPGVLGEQFHGRIADVGRPLAVGEREIVDRDFVPGFGSPLVVGVAVGHHRGGWNRIHVVLGAQLGHPGKRRIVA